MTPKAATIKKRASKVETEVGQIIQPQTIEKCSNIRENCRNETWGKMDELHKLEMDAINKINLKLAFIKGKEASNIWVKLLINLAPYILVVIILGIISLLKSKNLL